MKLPCDFVATIYQLPMNKEFTCAVPGCEKNASYMGSHDTNYVCKDHVPDAMTSEEGECPICLEPFKKSKEASKLTSLACRPFTCSHVFHIRCVEQWVKTGTATCPMCRKSL